MEKLFFKPLAIAICAIALFSCSEETVVSPEIETEESLNYPPCYDRDGISIPCKGTGPEYN